MRLPLVVWLLPCLLLSACFAPLQDHAVPDTYASMAGTRHDASTGREDVLAASPDPSALDAHVFRTHPRSATGGILVEPPFDGSPLKTRLHQTDETRAVLSMAFGHGLQGPIGGGALQPQFNGYELGDFEVPDWDSASTWRTADVVGNGCGMAADQNGGYADGDGRRVPCLFVSAESLPVAADLHTGEGFFSVSAGGNHTCSVQANAIVQCWGWNSDGQATPPGGQFVAVGAGEDHTCGIQTDNTVQCWGWNSDGQATPPDGRFVTVSAGTFHTCGVRTDNTVQCWGRDQYGPTTPPDGRFVAVSAGHAHTCGVRSDNTVQCWGDNEFGQVTPPGGQFVAVSAGDAHTCGVQTDNTVQCWGWDGDGQATPPRGRFIAVGAGEAHTCGVRTDNTVQCWGDNGYGQAAPPTVAGASASSGTSFASLHTAAGYGDAQTVAHLLANGADPDAVDGNGDTALHHTARHGHVLVADRLLEHGADPDVVNAHGSTPLHLAAWFGHHQVASRLLDYGAVLDTVDRWGNTPWTTPLCRATPGWRG